MYGKTDGRVCPLKNHSLLNAAVSEVPGWLISINQKNVKIARTKEQFLLDSKLFACYKSGLQIVGGTLLFHLDSSKNNIQNKFKSRRPVKKLIALLLLSFYVAGCGHVGAKKYEEIPPSKIVLIDVRTPLEYQNDHLEKSVNIPFDKIKDEIKYFAPDKEQVIMVYCQSGKRTDIAIRELKGLGYKNVINAGRFKELKEIEEKQTKKPL